MLSTSWWLWPDLYSKTEGCTHKETLLRKVYCYKNVRHTTVHNSKKFQINILIGYWINSIFPNRICFIEMLSLCDRDRHMKNFVLTKVFHIGQWNCFHLLWRHIPFCKKSLRSVAHTEKCWRFFKEGSCFRSHTVNYLKCLGTFSCYYRFKKLKRSTIKSKNI